MSPNEPENAKISTVKVKSKVDVIANGVALKSRDDVFVVNPATKPLFKVWFIVISVPGTKAPKSIL